MAASCTRQTRSGRGVQPPRRERCETCWLGPAVQADLPLNRKSRRAKQCRLSTLGATIPSCHAFLRIGLRSVHYQRHYCFKG
jgi:hypothetical protein